jgi:hypothetical protein
MGQTSSSVSSSSLEFTISHNRKWITANPGYTVIPVRSIAFIYVCEDENNTDYATIHIRLLDNLSAGATTTTSGGYATLRIDTLVSKLMLKKDIMTFVQQLTGDID